MNNLMTVPNTLFDLIAQAKRDVESHEVNFNDAVYIVWTKDGRFHRENGPALVSNIRQWWYKNGQLHNNTGPAVLIKGSPQQWARLWYVNGVNISDEVEAWLLGHTLPDNTETWTNQHKIYFKLTFGQSNNEC